MQSFGILPLKKKVFETREKQANKEIKKEYNNSRNPFSKHTKVNLYNNFRFFFYSEEFHKIQT